jgi:hypothetical protein
MNTTGFTAGTRAVFPNGDAAKADRGMRINVEKRNAAAPVRNGLLTLSSGVYQPEKSAIRVAKDDLGSGALLQSVAERKKMKCLERRGMSGREEKFVKKGGG